MHQEAVTLNVIGLPPDMRHGKREKLKAEYSTPVGSHRWQRVEASELQCPPAARARIAKMPLRARAARAPYQLSTDRQGIKRYSPSTSDARGTSANLAPLSAKPETAPSERLDALKCGTPLTHT